MIGIVLALLLGVVAGLRTMTAPAAISWAAWRGGLALDGTWLAVLGYRYTPFVLTALALVEFVTDQLPATPSRTVPVQFGARLASGALCGAAVGLPEGQLAGGLIAGVIGAVIGTLGGAAARGRLAAALGRDRPAAILEDVVAIILAALVVWVLS
ncbi:DUF4126 domain-containing protein [Methylobacterium oryzisoli]|uniref:DUF4126 domain-containing protein n=1 Tax=Methylobacterium oryzisoli TaxID=3385502 RepID=UPI0038919757